MTGGKVFSVGDRVRVMSDCPFRGCQGTIRAVNAIAPLGEDEKPFCFYKVALQGASIREPIWFECAEVELLASPCLVLERGGSPTGLKKRRVSP